MALVSGQATTFDLDNFVGELFRLGERPNRFLRAIGGITGGVRTIASSEFSVAVTYDLRAPSQPGHLEGADAPAREERSTAQDTNVVQIFQEAVEMSYSVQSNAQAIGGLAVIPGGSQGPLQVPGELDWQIARAIETVQQDMNFTFLQGVFDQPADNLTPRQTRGISNAIVTNISDLALAALTKADFEGLLKTMVDSGSTDLGDNLWAFANADQFENLAQLYESDANTPESRTVVGVQVRTILTLWGTVNIAYDPDVPAGEIILVDMSLVSPVARMIVADGETKGVLFVEPLAKTGSASDHQLYGEWGLAYGSEERHGKIINAAA